MTIFLFDLITLLFETDTALMKNAQYTEELSYYIISSEKLITLWLGLHIRF